MQFQKETTQVTLTIPMPDGIDTLKIIGRPRFLQIEETLDRNNNRILEVVCSEPAHFPSFEAFCDLVEKNVREKHLPALSVFLNVLRVWDWKENRKIA